MSTAIWCRIAVGSKADEEDGTCGVGMAEEMEVMRSSGRMSWKHGEENKVLNAVRSPCIISSHSLPLISR